MKLFLLILLSFVFFSCSKPDELNSVAPPVTNNTSVTPSVPVTPYYRFSLNGQPISFTSVWKERSRALKYLNVTAENDSIKVQLRLTAVNQTGNSTGLILIGSYDLKFYKKDSEGGFKSFPTIYQQLGIFDNNPLTDSVVTGNFSFNTSIPGSIGINAVSNGEFRLVF